MLLSPTHASIVLSLALALVGAPSGLAAVSFNRDIRPLLSENCFSCHGPDVTKVKANLRLDSRDAALKPAKSGERAIVPGKPEESEMLRRLASKDSEEVMPPPKEHKTIAPAQASLLRQWIADGAPYEGHWAFLPPQRPPLPPGAPATHPVDAFILERLKKEGLSAASAAPKETLARRVHLDLTGLPPTPAQLNAYLSDTGPAAYEGMVDRALALPSYGERMAIQWLDFARYADSNGFQSDESRQQWPWRDWTIAAFNKNTPFDRFTLEQIAGDLLPNPTREQIVATGFNRNHRLNGEGGLIPEEWFVETVIDRVETTGSTWLGLTFNCCRCHDHKFDPITQKEFFQLYAFFNSNEETGILGGGGAGRTGNTAPIIRLPNEEQQKQIAVLTAATAQKEALYAKERSATAAAQAAWEPAFKTLLEQEALLWVVPEGQNASSKAGATLQKLEDGSFLLSGKTADKDTLSLTLDLPDGRFSALQIESLNDPSLPNAGPARGGKTGPILTTLEVEITSKSGAAPKKVKFQRAEASSLAGGFSVKAAAGLEAGKGWAPEASQAGKPGKAVFVADEFVGSQEPLQLTVRLKQDNGGSATFGRLRVSVSGRDPSLVFLDPEKALGPVRVILALEPSKRSAAQKTALQTFFVTHTENTERRALESLVSARGAEKSFTESIQSVMVMQEKAQPKEAFILKRGEYDKPGDAVSRGLPASLPPMPEGAPMNRLGLAQWMVSDKNPLTARVWVNRAWERFFGVGIVKSTENFGVQAEWPIHPELLDWLAVEFMHPTALPPVGGVPAQAWDMKALQKMLLMSASYQQSSKVTPELLERDPDNRLLARGPRFRLSGELLRDQALAVSGLLVEKVGGPSVRPYMPEGVWDETSRYGDLLGYKPDKEQGLYRRSLYTIWKRTAAPPSMLLFDAPTRETCAVKRARTNTPLQALSLLNEVTYVEAARVLAQRMLREGGPSTTARIQWAFEKVTCRPAQASEVQILQKGLETRLERYQKMADKAALLTSQGASTPDVSFPAYELAAYTLTANVLLNLDEVITRE